MFALAGPQNVKDKVLCDVVLSLYWQPPTLSLRISTPGFSIEVLLLWTGSASMSVWHHGPLCSQAQTFRFYCTTFSQNKENLPCMEKNSHFSSEWKFHHVSHGVCHCHLLSFIPLSSCVSFLKCEGFTCEKQPVQTPPGPSERGAGPADQPAAFLRRGQRSSGQTVCAPAECGLPQGQKLLPRSVTLTFIFDFVLVGATKSKVCTGKVTWNLHEYMKCVRCANMLLEAFLWLSSECLGCRRRNLTPGIMRRSLVGTETGKLAAGHGESGQRNMRRPAGNSGSLSWHLSHTNQPEVAVGSLRAKFAACRFKH